MSGLTEPSPLAHEAQPESNVQVIVISIVAVLVVVGVIAVLSRTTPKTPFSPNPYASSLKLSDLKMSVAETFSGSSLTYIDGTVTNAGDKTVSRAIVHVNFKNSMNQVAQADDVPLHVLQTTGPYPDAVSLSASPLSPGQSKSFRLIFEHISADWNHAYPELQVTDVTLK
jgi:hypothetical protein